eukprot:TRINITY_DN626_c0_g1_i2.p1 TRINITY_DN626_c0_g1~~TRINITY_DN626_c0_g1_i2.p1  ORF type:complete len:625 (-),score=177.33 TRINITY_DN626_c0_g1_i2:2254-4023(-)
MAFPWLPMQMEDEFSMIWIKAFFGNQPARSVIARNKLKPGCMIAKPEFLQTIQDLTTTPRGLSPLLILYHNPSISKDFINLIYAMTKLYGVHQRDTLAVIFIMLMMCKDDEEIYRLIVCLQTSCVGCAQMIHPCSHSTHSGAYGRDPVSVKMSLMSLTSGLAAPEFNEMECLEQDNLQLDTPFYRKTQASFIKYVHANGKSGQSGHGHIPSMNIQDIMNFLWAILYRLDSRSRGIRTETNHRHNANRLVVSMTIAEKIKRETATCAKCHSIKLQKDIQLAMQRLWTYQMPFPPTKPTSGNQGQRPKLQLSEEQKQIVATSLSPGESLKIVAYAGTGKTFTLIQYCKARPKQSFLYLAFNKAIVTSAQKGFPLNVKCKTFHSIAWGRQGAFIEAKPSSSVPSSVYPAVIKSTLGFNFKNMSQVQYQIIKTLNTFFSSADAEVMPKHIPDTAKRYHELQVRQYCELRQKADKTEVQDETIRKMANSTTSKTKKRSYSARADEMQMAYTALSESGYTMDDQQVEALSDFYSWSTHKREQVTNKFLPFPDYVAMARILWKEMLDQNSKVMITHDGVSWGGDEQSKWRSGGRLM